MPIVDGVGNPDTSPQVIVIGASAGGVEALSVLVRGLPPDLSAAVFVVLHIPAHTPSALASILQRCTDLPVVAARDRDPILPGRIYVAPADRHLILEPAGMRVTRGPKENRQRPSVDALFRSASVAFQSRVIGIVLSGMLDDGTAGLWAIKDRGGKALVQEPASAQYPSMPDSALRHVEVDGVHPAEALAAQIVRLLGEGNGAAAEATPPRMAIENLIALEGNGLQAGVMKLGEVSAYTCPDCHGILVQIEEDTIVRFRCHTGHAFSFKTLLAEVNEAIDIGLWDTLRAIEERILLLRQMAASAAAAEDAAGAARCGEQAAAAEQRVATLHDLVLDAKLFGHGPERI
jgi:two-component system chemotaxis response regulator CheB